jgi:hypothetical protein
MKYRKNLTVIATLVIGMSILLVQRADLYLKERAPEVATQLYIQLDSQVSDYPRSAFFGLISSHTLNVWDMVKAIQIAANDPNISSLLIHVEGATLTFDQAESVGRAVNFFRSKGKQTTYYAPAISPCYGGVPAYLLASYCETILVQRMGEVRLDPLSAPVIAKQVRRSIIANRPGINILDDLMRQGDSYIDSQAIASGLVDSSIHSIEIAEHSIQFEAYVHALSKKPHAFDDVIAVIPATKEGVDSTSGLEEIHTLIASTRNRSEINRVILSLDDSVELNDVLKNASDSVVSPKDYNTLYANASVELVQGKAGCNTLWGDISGCLTSMLETCIRSIAYVRKMAS